jgi:hypothetical protein
VFTVGFFSQCLTPQHFPDFSVKDAIILHLHLVQGLVNPTALSLSPSSTTFFSSSPQNHP